MALEGYRQAVEGHPDPVKPVGGIAKVLVAKGRYQEAVTICDEYLKERPKDLRLNMIKAEILFRQDRLKDGEALLKQVISDNPGAVAPLLVMTRVHQREKDYARALEYGQKAVKVNPQNIEARMNLAAVYLDMGDFDAAASAYEELLAIHESYGPAVNNLAYLYADTGKNLDRAVELAKRAKELMPENAEVDDTLGYAYLKRGSFLLAKKAFREGIALSPRNPLLHYHLGLLLYEEKDYSSATIALQTALNLGLGAKEKSEIDDLLRKMREKES
jgi:Flp pilus assembly protein TadD